MTTEITEATIAAATSVHQIDALREQLEAASETATKRLADLTRNLQSQDESLRRAAVDGLASASKETVRLSNLVMTALIRRAELVL